ncbi:hypothetical protein [Rhodoblastus acidophilus]|uniref:hypothetical protein n=1 Tax=Rhodoblastus acidophilus TaxID=1074 RepID=UPI00113224AD|nr:hypothetical protein [Rhodoblastus acidophilus]
MKRKAVTKGTIGGAPQRPLGSRLVAAFRRLLLCLTLVGLVFAPVSSFAHQPMDSGAAVSMADDEPCSSHDMPDGCQDCALMASCAIHCFHIGVSDFGVSFVADWEIPSPVAAPEQPVNGIDHAPPRRPPREKKGRGKCPVAAFNDKAIGGNKYCIYTVNNDLHPFIYTG